MNGHGHDPANFILALTLAVGVGAFLITMARRLGLPSIVLLLAGGVILGPEMMGIVKPSDLGDTLSVLVALFVGIILFEGGLTLDLNGYKSTSTIIRRLLYIGVAITWGGGALAIFLIFGLPLTFSLLAASLTIVTGPTVITPLLRRIRVKANLHHILHWEAVLIDPIGAFIAILCFELMVEGMSTMAWSNLLVRIVVGIALGIIGGRLIAIPIKRGWVADDLLNVFTLGSATLLFGVAEAIKGEAGLLVVTVAGLSLGSTGMEALKKIRTFKKEIVDLLIGTLFILLSARLEFAQFAGFGWQGLFLLGVILFVVRPLSVWVCSAGLSMTWREKAFLSWVAPRGIVAASIASLFTLAAKEKIEARKEDPPIEETVTDYAVPEPDPQFLETFTYSVIVGTVVLQGLSAGWVAKLLKLQEDAPRGWLIVGAHPFARIIAGFLMEKAKAPVLLVDGNRKSVGEARAAGYRALYTDARDVAALEERGELQGIGNLLALTDNEDLNSLLCQRWSEAFGADRVHRWHSGQGIEKEGPGHAGQIVWTRLAKPSLIVRELNEGQARISRKKLEKPEPGHAQVNLDELWERRPLLAVVDDDLRIDPKVEQLKAWAKEGRRIEWISLRREADYLSAALEPGLILDLEEVDIPEAIAAVVEKMASRYTEIDAKAITEDLLNRERLHPTHLGHESAVAQAMIDGLPTRLCGLARLAKPAPYVDEEAKPVQLLFVLISPPDHRERHLATLGEIARMVSDHEPRTEIMEAENTREIVEAIHRSRPVRMKSDEETKFPSALQKRQETKGSNGESGNGNGNANNEESQV